VKAILERHHSGRGDHSLQIWALLMLEHWHGMFVDSDRPAHAMAP